MAHDFKKIQKELYQPKTEASLIDVPEMKFLMIDGAGDPNTSPAYAEAVQVLYGLSYTIRMNKTWDQYFEYVVPPLEGRWEVLDADFTGGGAAITDKNKLIWTGMIRQPDFVTVEVFEEAKKIAAIKKPDLDLSKIRLVTFREGLCIQIMHIGSYDEEPATIAKIAEFAKANGLVEDFTKDRGHHEIYLSDPRKSEPSRLKTIIRHPVRFI
ncbi:MAG: GyrI-like domain-containing protein [Clostridiaceae bacterium]